MTQRRRKRIVLALLAFICVGGVGYVFTHGGSVTVLRLPPVRDASTPAAQNGYLLLGVRREPDTVHFRDLAHPAWEYERNGGYQLQVQAPLLAPAAMMCAAAPTGIYTVTARSSTGDGFPLFWRADVSSGLPRLLITIPPAYPDTYRFLDVLIGDRNGQTARWRFTRLQRVRPTFPTPATIHDTVQVAGLTLRGQAFWQESRGVPVSVMAYVGITGRPNTGLHYDIGVGDMERDWVPFALNPLPVLSQNPNNFSSLSISDTNNPGGGLGSDVQANDTPYDHYVTLDAILNEYDSYDETVTFRNVGIVRTGVQGDKTSFLVVRHPQTQTTPSGVTVILPTQTGVPNGFRWVVNSTGVNLLIVFPQNVKSIILPSSPLYRKYRRPVSITTDFPPPMRSGGGVTNDQFDGRLIAFLTPKTPPARLNTLTLIIRQRVDLRTIPVHFVLPIAPAPPVFPKPSHKPAPQHT